MQIKKSRDQEWGRLARLQDEIVRQEEEKKRQRQSYHKLLYKNELQKMIEEKNLRNYAQVEKKYGEQYQTINNDLEEQHRSKIMHLVKQSSQYNYSQVRNQRMRLRSELQEQKLLHRQKYRKAETERSEEQQRESLEKIFRKKEFAQLYKEQISQNESRKYLQKLENRKFEQLAQQIQSRKQIERINHINKIKYGYSQNPETYETLQHINNKKQQEKQIFLRNHQTQKVDLQPRRKRRSYDLKQVSDFNKKHSQQKEQWRKVEALKNLENESTKIMSIQQQLRLQFQKSRLRKETKQKELKLQLERQMEEATRSKLSWERMNQNEQRINQSYLKFLPPISIPGLYRDHKDVKRDQIIDKFLTNQKYDPKQHS